MEVSSNITCPVCTLYLRPGITLETHLLSHPKQKVIEALCKVVQPTGLLEPNSNEQKIIESENPTSNMAIFPPGVNANIAQINQVPVNQSFIYQQFMSSSATQPMVNQQFVAVPAVFNPQMMCPPYIYQQQQQVQIMSAGTNISPFISPRPMNVLSNPAICPSSSVSEIMDPLRNTTISEVSHTSNMSDKQCNDDEQNNYSTNTNKDSMEPDEEEDVLNTSQICETSDEIISDELNNCSDTNSQITIKKNMNNDENLTIVASYASNIHNRDPLININKMDTNMHSIPKGLDEEEQLQKEESDEEEENNPDIIIETNGNDLVSVTITNVGQQHARNSLSENDVDHENMEDNELSKTCQTTTIQTVQHAPKETHNEVEVDQLIVIASEDFNKKIPDIEISSTKNNFMQKINDDADNAMQTTNITVLDMADVDFILPNDFMHNGQSIISRVNDIECLNEANRNDRPQILMSLGEESLKNSDLMYESKYQIVSVPNFEAEKLDDESLSRESLNIRADERMPPRGELSEQESNGASEVGWGSRIYQEGSSGMSTSYDLLARESWEASDCSDTEISPLQSRIQLPSLDYKSDDVDDPDEMITKSPIFDFNCSTCGATFRCPKERRVHQTQEHSIASSSSTVTSRKIMSPRKNQKRQIENTVNTEKDTSLLPIFLKKEKSDEPINEMCVDIKEAKIEIDSKENFLCNACGELLPSKKEWNNHNKKVHGIKIPNQNLVCKKCDVAFTSHDKFTEHLKIHPLECSICGKNFYKIPNLKIHLRRHTGIRPHKCEVCTKAFFSKQKLAEHSNIHTGNAPIRCTMCNQSFKRYSNLVQHRNRHHLNIKKKIKDYICHCGEVFHSKSKLQWHKETHESKPKGCKYCHEKFIHMASLTRHIRRIHNQRYVPDISRENENVECDICKGVYLKSSLDAHMQTHTGKKQHSCPICSKEFTTKWNLKLHKWTHASPNSKPFKCELCQAAYIRQNDYTSHMNSHKSLRPYTCNYCGCKFIRKYNCIRHVREHEEGKSFNCVICNKSFHRSYYLNEHMRVHSGIRPYSCHICGKSSTTKSNHNKHMKIHHAREPIMTEG